MQPQTDGDYQKLLTELIKKQIIILGPDITLAKARNVPGLTIADDGSVTEIKGNPQEMIQMLIEQFVELSGMIVKKTMEPLLSNYPGLMNALAPATAAANVVQQAPPTPTAQPTPTLSIPQQPIPAPVTQTQPIAAPQTPLSPVQTAQPTVPVQTTTSGEAGSRSAGQPQQNTTMQAVQPDGIKH